jgi:DHA1 family bicyclomycin/chloramphenicol resistance-like MFS transporter
LRKEYLAYVPFILLLGLALDIYIPSIPSMMHYLRTTDAEIQLSLSVFMYTFGGGQLIVGPLSERFGRKPMLNLSLIIFTIGSILCCFASNLSFLIFGRCLQAFGACGSQVITLSMVRDRYDGVQATSLFTLLKAAMGIAPIIAPIGGAFLQIKYGWQACFVVLAIYGLFCLSFVRLALPTCKLANKELKIIDLITPYANIINNKSFLYYSFAAISAQAAMFGFFSLSPRFYIIYHNLSEQTFGILFSLNALAFLITGFLATNKIAIWGTLRSTVYAAGLYAVSGILMLSLSFVYDNYWILLFPNLIASGASAIMLGASTSGALMPFKHKSGNASALLGSLEFLIGGFIGSLVIYNILKPLTMLALILLSFGILTIIAALYIKTANGVSDVKRRSKVL